MALPLVLFLAAVQGATELFPISSLGHSVVLPALFHLGVDTGADSYVPFLTLLHLGTAAALLFIYRHDWAQIIAGFCRASLRGKIGNDTERLAMQIAIGTVPAGLVGVILQTPLKHLFAKPGIAGGFLVLNGAILFGAEMLRRRDERRITGQRAADKVAGQHAADRVAGRTPEDPATREEQEAAYAGITSLNFVKATLVGFAQVLALIPGISRSGVTMAAGLASGLRHEEALRFSFLLATPIIAAAGVLEVPQLLGAGIPLGTYALGAVVAGVIAYISARFLIRYFRIGRLDPFAGYCAALGIATIALVR